MAPPSPPQPSGSADAGRQDPGPVESVRRLLHRRLKVGVSDGRVFVGRFHCLDKQGNLILFDTHEFVPRRHFPPSNGESASARTRECVSDTHSQAADGNVSQEEQGAGRVPPSSSTQCSEQAGAAVNSRDSPEALGTSSNGSAREAQGDSHSSQDPRNGFGGSNEDALRGAGGATSTPPPSDTTHPDSSAGLSTEREAKASPVGGSQRPATSQGEGGVHAGAGGPSRTSPAAEAPGGIGSLLPPAPAHPVAVPVQPGAGQPQTGRTKGEKGQEDTVDLVEQRRLGMVLIPVHARVSCQLECELDEDLSFLSLSEKA